MARIGISLQHYLAAKVPKSVLIVLRVKSSGATRNWKYQLDGSIVDRYFALVTVPRIMDKLGMVLSVFLVISFLGTRSASGLISPFGLSLGNMFTGLLAWHGYMISFCFRVLEICLYTWRILSGTVNIFGLGAEFA